MKPLYQLFNCACGCGKCDEAKAEAKEKIVNDEDGELPELDDMENAAYRTLVTAIRNRGSSKTTAKPSKLRISQQVIARKDTAGGIHKLTPDRVARMEAAARTAEYRERVKESPAEAEDDTHVPLHDNEGATVDNRKPDTEALKNAATAMESVRRTLSDIVATDPRFKVPPAATGSPAVVGGPWVQDILTPDENGHWTAIVSRQDGKLVKAKFTFVEGVVSMLPDEPVLTGMQVIYNREDAVTNGKPCGDSFIADDLECRVNAAKEASEKAEKSGTAEDHKAADEANVQAAMAYSKRTHNKPSSPDVRADIAREMRHADTAKKHRDAATLAERVSKHQGEMSEASREYAQVASMKGSAKPEERAKHDAAYERLRAAHIEQQSIAAKMDGFDDVAKWIESKRGKLKNDERAIAEFEFVAGVIANQCEAERLGIAVNVCDKLTNRFSVPADGWIHIAPIGNHSHPKGLMQVIDRKSVEAMVSNFDKRKESDPKFPGVLVDFDHFSQSGDKPSEAAGWIENLQRRDDGLWAKVRWSDVGEKAVNGGRYRLVSPVWLRKNCETLDNNEIRPLVLDSVALTNEPNLKGLTPLTA